MKMAKKGGKREEMKGAASAPKPKSASKGASKGVSKGSSKGASKGGKSGNENPEMKRRSSDRKRKINEEEVARKPVKKEDNGVDGNDDDDDDDDSDDDFDECPCDHERGDGDEDDDDEGMNHFHMPPGMMEAMLMHQMGSHNHDDDDDDDDDDSLEHELFHLVQDGDIIGVKVETSQST